LSDVTLVWLGPGEAVSFALLFIIQANNGMSDPPLTDKIKLSSDVYFDATNTIRHYDTQRASFASFAASGLTLLFAFLAAQDKKGGEFLPTRLVSFVILLFSLASILLSVKLDSLIKRHRLRARLASEILSEMGVDSISKIDDKLKQSQVSLIDKIRIGWLWISLFFVFALASLISLLFASSIK
jgi:hypothetical protein